MKIIDAIKERRSVRYFEDKPVSKELLYKIIDAGRWAPSACNRQAWRFIVISDPTLRKKLTQEVSAYYIDKVPLLILICYSNRADNREYQDWIQSASGCIQNMQLACMEYGLASVWADNLPTKRTLRKIFKIPWYYDPIASLSIGYPKVKVKPMARKGEINDLIAYNKFNFKVNEYDTWNHFSKANIKLRIKIILRYIFFRLPRWLKVLLNPIARRFEKRFDKYNIEI